MTGPAALEANGLGKLYRGNWALQDCSFRLPAGRVAALVGPNGSGKSTLLQLAAGLISPTSGQVRTLGLRPDDPRAEVLPTIGFLAQDQPLYKNFSVNDLLAYGRHTNPRWDDANARHRLDGLGIPLKRKAGTLSGGQQTEVALSLCLSKRPDLLLLDEPVSRLDPLARVRFLSTLMDVVASEGTTVMVSSHVLSDLERVCDFVIILSGSRVQIAQNIEELLATHRILIGIHSAAASSNSMGAVIRSSQTDRQTTLLVRGRSPVVDPRWDVRQPTLEEIVLAYLENPSAGSSQRLETLGAS
jgi:ABC-2 type transport system ATP-binding protein